MNNAATADRKTIPVPAASLSDAALMADYRTRRNDRLSAEELAEVMCGTTLGVTGADMAKADAAQTRWVRSRRGGL